MNIAICDDHEFYVSQLHEICDQTLAGQNIDYTIYEFHSGKELLECDIPMQILLIDQRLGDIQGIEVCRIIRQRDRDVIIIFVSDYAEAAKPGYKLNVFNYIFKEELPDQLVLDLREALLELGYGKPHFDIPELDVSMPLDDIMYFKSKGKMITLHPKKPLSTITFQSSLQNIINRLPNLEFKQIHRSYIVNFRYVDLMLNYSVTLKDKTILPTSRLKYAEVKTDFKRWGALNNGG